MIAIAATLLVLDVGVPHTTRNHGLASGLGHEWPVFAGYAVSFLTIGVIWINHHAMLRRLARIDHTVLVLNLLLLMLVAILPWTTLLMADYLQASHGQGLAAAIYSGSFLAMSCVFFAILDHALRRRPRELTPQLSDAARRSILRRNRVGLLPYAVATAAAPLSPYLTLAICGAIAVFYAWPTTTSDAPAPATR